MSISYDNVLHTALSQKMGSKAGDNGPMDLRKTITKTAIFLLDEVEVDSIVDGIIDEILLGGPDNHLRNLLGQYLSKWDSIAEPTWTDTPINSSERRRHIYALLNLSEQLSKNLGKSFPCYVSDNTVFVISDEYQKWYMDERKRNRFYWDRYSENLIKSGWPHVSLEQLDDSTDEILDRLDDPTKAMGSKKRGLVVGYVQSGKTANFTGLIAKAIDAGYKIIIIMAGTLNVLRSQTQRRIDKELIGKENLMASLQSLEKPEDYENDSGWASFVEYGTEPTPPLERITDSKKDYAGGYSKQLVPPRAKPARSARDQGNRNSPVKIIVVKKQKQVLAKLIKDFKNVKNDIYQHPVLVIDDESDQASVNVAEQDSERSAINNSLIELLEIFAAAQYVGYTATPVANIFIDSDERKDLFPRDFVLTLPRPLGYMGVRDLYDFDENWNDVADENEVNRIAYVRDIDGEDAKRENIPKAINSFILTGAIKLFRSKRNDSVSVKHHTMLVHTDVRQSEHNELATMIKRLFKNLVADEIEMYKNLRSLYTDDFLKTSEEILQSSFGAKMCSFDDLVPFIGQCIERVCVSPVRIVNSESKNQLDMPNFDEEKVWSILVGGAKLSRGYTVEGLTISYFRRVAGQGDTLMQAGRWFGFRRGYQDIVRLYIGVNEKKGKTKTVDLYEDFKGVCRDEEQFRQELHKYHLKDDGTFIKPVDVEPLVPVNLLPPTAKNKMRDVTISTKNLGESWKESAAHISHNKDHILTNMESVTELLRSSTEVGRVEFTTDDFQEDALLYKPSRNEDVEKFLKGYKWSKEGIISDELAFIETKLMDNNIKTWTIMLPQLADEKETFKILGDTETSLYSRGLNLKKKFKVLSDPKHRKIAKWLSKVNDEISITSSKESVSSSSTAILVIYPLTIRNPEKYPEIVTGSSPYIGFAIQFPGNNVPTKLFYTK